MFGLGLLYPQILLPQFSRILSLPKAPQVSAPSELAPDRLDSVPRPNAPASDQVYINSDERQESQNSIHHLRGHAVIETSDSLLRADEIDYNEETADVEARGHVFYQNFIRKEQLTCDRLEYNLDDQKGKFYNVHGYVKRRIDAAPGVLTSDNPFYFEAKWAERVEEKYILHDGLITGCKLPHPWWTVRGPRFDVVPNQHAIAYSSWFRIRQFPIFYTPFFYKSLEKEPRQSGFLSPTIGNSSRRGMIFGAGYYWAINRSYDATYRFQDFTARGYAHSVEVRGKPFRGADFDFSAYGVQDRGASTGACAAQTEDPVTHQKTGPGGCSGALASFNGTASLGDGWLARGSLNYLSSITFRQEFTESFNEAVFSEVTSTGVLDKHVGPYNFDFVSQRLQVYQDTADPGDYVLLRKLPEVNFSSRDHQISDKVLPIFLSFDTTAGLYYRRVPNLGAGADLGSTLYASGNFVPRINLQPQLMTEVQWHGFTLAPYFTLHETYFGDTYRNTPAGLDVGIKSATTQSLNRFAPEFGADLILPSIEKVIEKKTIFGDKLKHVIEPRVTYRQVSNVDNFQNLILFDETEILTDTSQAEISLTNRIYARRGENVEEILTWKLAQQRYFDPDFGGAVVFGQRNVIASSLQLSGYAFLDRPRRYSPIASNLRLSPIPGFAIEWMADYDPLRQGLTDSSVTADVHFHRYTFSASNNATRGIQLFKLDGTPQTGPQQFLSPEANQFRALVGYGDSNRKGFSSAFSAVYDYKTSQLQFATTQFTYNTDCCGFSVQFRRLSFGIRNENQFRLSFTVANVGSFGTLRRQERIF